MHIWIRRGTKFHFKQTNLNFRTKFAQKGYFRSKNEKVNITIEFSQFELVYNQWQNIMGILKSAFKIPPPPAPPVPRPYKMFRTDNIAWPKFC